MKTEMIIYGLYGDRKVSVAIQEPVTIIMAENGTGKTTSLRFIDAIFRGQIEKLLNYDFKYVEIKRDGKVSLKVHKKDLMNPYIRVLSSLSKNGNKNSYELRDLVDSYVKDKQESTFHALMRNWIHEKDDFEMIYNLRHMKLDKTTLSILESIGNEKREGVIFWPTYRRIEKDICVIENKNKEDDVVAFGMKDISSMFRNIEQELRKEALDLSSNINKDMIVHALRGENPPDDFFNDIQSKRNDIELMLERTQVTKEKKRLIDVIFNENFKENKALSQIIYHLTEGFIRLKKKDEKIEAFIKVINKYLIEKEMVYDNRCVRIYCKDALNQKEIDLDYLSSGEKHIIGMLSTLYLSDKKYVIIIDEPEISLSTEWQQMFVGDVMKSGSVSQIICATHSPFIFENEYAKYVTTLTVSRIK